MDFVKMHGLGNDFILINGIDKEDIDYNKLALKICDRHLGIGADGLEVVLPSENADIRMRIINSDGSEAEMCGNGIRCFSKYCFERGIVKSSKFKIETLAGIMEPECIIKNGKVIKVKVNMGEPGLDRKDIPMTGNDQYVINEKVDVNGIKYNITSMLMGVPHTVVFVDDVEKVDIESAGPAIERCSLFPKRTNVNFVQVLNDSEMNVKTWERGAGVTLACGTGSCASVVAAYLNKKTGRKAVVHLKVGDLSIEWAENNHVYMTGPAAEVFTGSMNI